MSYFPIKLDKTRNFRYGMRALDQIEKKLKKPISKIDMNNMTMHDLAVFIWAGLYHEDKDLTPEKVMDLVDEYSSLQEISVAMTEAFQESVGGDEEGEKNE